LGSAYGKCTIICLDRVTDAVSALRRIASGSSASLVGVIVNVVGQIALVPLFLAHWDQVTFGIWATIQGFQSLMQLIDYGHQDYVGFECLRRPIEDRAWRSRVLSSALPFLLFSGSTPALIVGVMWLTGSFAMIFHSGGTAVAAVGLGLYAVSWLIAQSLCGLFGRVVASIGHAPAQQWNTVILAIVSVIAQLASVCGGAGIVGAIVAQSSITVVYQSALSYRYLRLLQENGIFIVRPDFRLGGRNLFRSFALTLGQAVEALQLTGFRVILSPMVGPALVAQFSTLRTVANTAQQGTNMFVYPAVPELMRVASARSSAGTIAILGLLWLLAVMLIAPGIVVLQLVAPIIYGSWTRGKIPWDGMTFALLSSAIVINGFTQPAKAILRGNNLLRQQILISFISAIVLLGTTWILVPHVGLLGAGVSLVLGEIVRCALGLFWARRWLLSVELDVPTRTMAISGVIVVACGTAVACMAHWPRSALGIAALFIMGWAIGLALFWRVQPAEVQARLRPLLRRMSARRRLSSDMAAGRTSDDVVPDAASTTENSRAPA
jgi:O-antigen/teichoic acid export membrane protein